eukprot:9024123-Prorocentrum_lima.AAC.1
MTSSLVGSEMCIRDSSAPEPTNCAGELICRVLSLPPIMHSVSCQSTVSYTHLTLPTICSV